MLPPDSLAFVWLLMDQPRAARKTVSCSRPALAAVAPLAVSLAVVALAVAALDFAAGVRENPVVAKHPAPTAAPARWQ